MEMNTRIVLVDSDFRRRAAITHCLSGQPVHVEPFEDVSELIVRWPSAGILLVHDDGRAIDRLMQQMGQKGIWLPVVGYAESPQTRQVVQAVLLGAIDYIAWPFSPEHAVAVLGDVSEKAERFGKVKLREAIARGRVDRLTRREREVLTGVAGGLSNRLIGERLSISPRTVEIHRANMMVKMDVAHASDAIRIAIEATLV